MPQPGPLGCSRGSCSSSLVFPGARRVGARASWKEGLVSRDGLCPGCSQHWQLSHGELPSLPDSSLARGTIPCQFGGFFSPPNFLMIHC